MNQSINYEAVCRTASATPGLLIRLGKLSLGNFTKGNLTLGKFMKVYLPLINLPKVFYLVSNFYEIFFLVMWLIHIRVAPKSQQIEKRKKSSNRKEEKNCVTAGEN